MKTTRSICLVGLCLTTITFVASCETVNSRRVCGRGPGIGHGPPAHAPAHGHRRHIAGYDMIYDSGYGLYVVVGVSDCYYHNGYFYRLHGDAWQISVRAEGGWTVVDCDMLPPGLRAKTRSRVASGTVAKAKTGLPGRGKAVGHAKLK